MTKECRRKLQASGFLLLRELDNPSPRINQYSSAGNWILYKKFDTKASRDREVERIKKEEFKMIFE